ncbi:unnamed protein product, partial [Strongylus vulgaris]
MDHPPAWSLNQTDRDMCTIGIFSELGSLNVRCAILRRIMMYIGKVKWHIKWMHKDDKELEPISHENEYRKEIDQLNEECFPGWQHRRKPFWWLDNDDKKSEAADEAHVKHEELDLDEDTTENGSTRVKEGTPSSMGNDAEESTCCDSPDGSVSEKDHVGQPMKRVSEWTCRLCLKEFKPTSNFLRHVAKDHLDMPLFQC